MSEVTPDPSAGTGPEFYRNKGNEAFKSLDWDEAITNYNKAISLDPNQAAFYSNRAACWSRKGDHRTALADASKCLELDPTFLKGYSRKGKALFDLRRWDEAEATYQEGLRFDPASEVFKQGITEIKAARRAVQRAAAAASAGPAARAGGGGFARRIFGLLHQAGRGGRLVMYLLLMAGLYTYKALFQDQGRGEAKPPPGASLHSTTSDTTVPLELRRAFSEVDRIWISYLEAESKAQTLLLLLHRTGLSAEVEFQGVMELLLERAKEEATYPGPALGLRLLAPDRLCHGFSPCPPTGREHTQEDVAWLEGLLSTRQAPDHLAVVAAGHEAARLVFRLLEARKEPAQVLLIDPRTTAVAPTSSTGPSRDSCQNKLSSSSAAAATVAGASTIEENGLKLPWGSGVTILMRDGEEDRAFTEFLEAHGTTVKTRLLRSDDEPTEQIAAQAWQLLLATAIAERDAATDTESAEL